MQMIRSSKVAHQHVVEFLFLFGALIVALGFGFLLLLFFVRRGAFLLSGGGGAGALSVFGSSAATAEMDVASVAIVSMRTRPVFMRVSPFNLRCMKASRDGLALYTMQNGIGARLFRCEAEDIFCESGNKTEKCFCRLL